MRGDQALEVRTRYKNFLWSASLREGLTFFEIVMVFAYLSQIFEIPLLELLD